MKTSLMILVFVMFSSFAFSQSENETIENVNGPQFICLNENPGICTYMLKNISYPSVEEKYLIEGTVVVKFSVLPTGDLSDFKVVNSLSENCDNAVIRAIESTQGMWKPAKVDGVPVKNENEICVLFRIDGNDMYKYARYYAKKADELMNKGKYDRARKFYNKSITIDPYNAATLYQRGIASYLCGDQESAISEFERLSELDGSQADSTMFWIQKADNITMSVLDENIQY